MCLRVALKVVIIVTVEDEIGRICSMYAGKKRNVHVLSENQEGNDHVGDSARIEP
jgi:hypothetical protein